ncbi:hypothetical protein ABVT39_025545 [Epinephelus coioides]
MCCLLPLAALLFLSIVPSVTEVVESMSDCAEFLLEQPPDVPGVLEGGRILDQNRYKVICQTLSNVRTFVTLYDTQNRIPVFSANKYRGVHGSRGKRPDTPWKIEPQLETGNKNMVEISKIFNNQAGDNDYKNQTVYDRGHLFPSSYGMTENDRKATFTLTNIVPQEGTFNKGSWQKMESCIKCVLDKYCINNNVTEGFLVIGAQPGNNKLKDRVNIPSMLWNLYISPCYHHIFPSQYNICPSHNYNWPRYYDNQYSLNYCCYHFGHHCTYNYRNTNNFYCTNNHSPHDHNICCSNYPYHLSNHNFSHNYCTPNNFHSNYSSYNNH